MLAGGSGPGGFNAVPSSNPAGVGNILNYIGKYAYAYSGTVDVDNNETIMLKFATGNQGIIAKVQFGNALFNSLDYKFTVQINSEVVAIAIANFANTAPTTTEGGLSVIIPPNSEVKITGQNVESSATKSWTASLTGEILQ